MKFLIFLFIFSTSIFAGISITPPSGGAGGAGTTQNSNLDIIEGGDWSFDGNDLILSADAYIQHPPFLDDRNTIAAQTISLTADQVAYVDVNKTTDSQTNLTVNKVDVGSYVEADDRYVFLRRLGSSITIAEQQDFETTANMIGFGDLASWRAQSFVATASENLTEIKMKFFREVSLVGPFKIKIQADSAGDPSGSDLEVITVTAGEVAALPTSASGIYQSYPAAGTLALVNGTTYWMVYDPDFTAGGFLKVEYGASSGYAGDFFTSSDSGSTWSNAGTLDLAFEILNATSDVRVQIGKKMTLLSGDSAPLYSGTRP